MRGINGIIRLLLMFGPMIFNQIRRFQRSRAIQAPRPQAQQRRPARKEKEQAIEEEYYEDDIPAEDDFVEPINK